MVMQRRTVNLRADTPIAFVRDSDQERAYELEVRDARSAQRCQYAVAPRQRLRLADGRTLEAGAEVRHEQFVFSSTDGPAWRQLERLIARGIVIESDRWPSNPEAA